MGIQIVAQRPGDAFLLAAVAVRRIENLEKFNEIVLELKRRPHGGRKALFLCVFAERNQVHPLQILFQLLPVGFRHGAGARQGENEILRRIVKFRRGAPGYVVRVKFIGQAVFAVGIEMHPARRGLFLQTRLPRCGVSGVMIKNCPAFSSMRNGSCSRYKVPL